MEPLRMNVSENERIEDSDTETTAMDTGYDTNDGYLLNYSQCLETREAMLKTIPNR
jgi:hypothetical protein